MTSVGPDAYGEVRVTAVDGRRHVVMAGDIDQQLAARFHEVIAILGSGDVPIEVDLAAVDFMGSTGLSFFAALSTLDCHVRVLNTPPFVRELLALTQIDRSLELVD